MLLFPFPTQGHLTPVVSLATQLAEAGILVTLIHTPSNFALLRHVPHPRMRLEVIPIHHHDPNPFAIFERNVDASSSALHSLIISINPHVSCLISDSFMPWTLDVAHKLGIPRIEFWTSSVSGYCLGYHLPQIVAKGYLPFKPGTEDAIIDFVPGVAPLRVADLARDMLVHDESHLVFQFLCRAFSRGKEAAKVFVNSFYDLEASAVEALKAKNVCIVPIGPLLPTTATPSDKTSLLPQDEACLNWLDTRADVSVVYVSFGSVSVFSREEIQELALGLEDSEQPFLWSIRPDAIDGRLSEVLPAGFQARTAERGLIVSWAPQLAVLGHRAVGCFLSHCGWNSTLESMWMGVPMLGYPRKAEQNTNLKFIKDWEMGIGLEGQQMKRGAIQRSIMAMMLMQQGTDACRRRALKLRASARRAVADGGSSAASVQAFVQELKTM